MEKKTFVSIAETYFNRFPVLSKQLISPVPVDLGIAIVIPAFDEPELKRSLDSILQCSLPNDLSLEVIIVVNHPEGSSSHVIEQNLQNIELVKIVQKGNLHKKITFHVIYASGLPKKNAGVGWARKIGMDEASRRFLDNKTDGLICCFDADSLVDKNYLTEISKAFNKFELNGASVYFEHPISGKEFDKNIYDSILMYETHLRYYKNALKYCGLPYSYHTVGSSMVVKASAYCKQGGMNRRKAGEDFYFINKIIELGSYGEINSTRVIPSPRISERVPFGTGRAILDGITLKRNLNLTYSFEMFHVLKEWMHQVINKKDYEYDRFHFYIKSFIKEKDWIIILNEINDNTSSEIAFKHRFFKKFDAFWVLKYAHHIKENYLPDSSLIQNSNKLINIMGKTISNSLIDALLELRKIDRQ